MISDSEASEFIDHSDFVWHQRFYLSQNVATPGVNDIEWLWSTLGIPESLNTASVLDIGTSNGGVAFMAERRGAKRVVAVDVVGPDHFGFERIRRALDSKVEFVKAPIYELPELLEEQFDAVFCLGVLYHLRHPLLALDALRRLTRGTLYVESAISGTPGDASGAAFYRFDELNHDSSNWFSPTIRGLVDWVESAGFVTEGLTSWPEAHPARASLRATPIEGQPEFARISLEVPLSARRCGAP
jgi:tRNA (mo5U34)-methyltransferase